MPDYKIILKNGYVHEGDDERWVDDLLAVASGDKSAKDEELQDGWCWLASLYVKPDEIVAIVLVPVDA